MDFAAYMKRNILDNLRPQESQIFKGVICSLQNLVSIYTSVVNIRNPYILPIF